MAGDYRADTTLVRAVPGRAPGRLPQRERDLRRTAAPAGLRRSFATYDKRLLDAAQAAGLPIDAPA
jgi:hypothetical protein